VYISIVLLIGIAAFWPAAEARAENRTLHPDLAFNFVCKDKDRSALEGEIERFLRHEGFKVLNQGRIQREHGIFLLETHIIGLDDKRRMVDLTSSPHTEDRYSLGLNTPPPTQRAPQFEEALLKFVSNKLGCEVRHMTRGDNGADASEFHNSEVKRVENLFREAEELHGERRL